MTETTKEQRVAALKTAIERGGGIVRFSKDVGVRHQAVYQWMRRGHVPADKALTLETLYGVPRAETMSPALAAVLTTPPVAAADIL